MKSKKAHESETETFISDLIENRITGLDMIARIFRLTGYDKYALILLKDEIENTIGLDVSENLLNYFTGKSTDESVKAYMKHTNAGNALEFIDSKIAGTPPACFDIENKLSLAQIALICQYNGRKVTRKNAVEIAKEYGYISVKLTDVYNQMQTPNERITWGRETEKNRKQFEAIEPFLNQAGKARWRDEYETIKKRRHPDK